jgi:Transglycosylase-like domain
VPCIRLFILILAAWAALASPATASKHHPRRTHAGDLRWGHKHHWHPPFRFSRFELCVANRESGDGQATPSTARYVTINWRYHGEGYEGAFNWVNSTWLAMGGGRYAQHAYDASPEQQTLVFRANANSQDWPQTVPACR